MIRFPEPPSANAMWRSVVIKGQVRVLLSAEGRQFKQDVKAVWLQRPVRERVTITAGVEVAVRIQWHRARKSGDTDNRIKPTLDSLRGLWYADDKQVASIHATRHESPGDGFVLVDVTPLTR